MRGDLWVIETGGVFERGGLFNYKDDGISSP